MRKPLLKGGAKNPAETRCAIYTRKSSEEGLEQEFNSLHAQREACEAYIRSQRHEGWRILPALYDDGGFSGGNLERPALVRLLRDIRERRVDLIVIYKVDRLTRSLADFAKLVEQLNEYSVSFVSVTQQFNTATSMGRLTLNMLLSFAQFEREVTGERIRDKIAASKRKGLWMGGVPPLGYDVRDRKLVVNPTEAAQVERIFRLYVELGSVRLLGAALERDGIRTKRHVWADGTRGGQPISRGHLYAILQNRLYRGEIVHKENAYPGEHDAIIDAELWDAVQRTLAQNRVDRDDALDAENRSILAGIAFDHAGNRLTPSHAQKGSRRYRYYVSNPLVAGALASDHDGQRIPAAELENLVADAVHDLIAAPNRLLERIGTAAPDAVQQKKLLSAADRLARSWPELGSRRIATMLQDVVQRVDVGLDEITVTLSPGRLGALLAGTEAAGAQGHGSDPVVLTLPAFLKRTGQEMRLIVGGPDAPAANPALVRLVREGVRYRDMLLASPDQEVTALAAEVGITGSHFTRLMRLGFLAPDIIAAILAGRQPAGLNATALLRDTRLPLDWPAQRRMLGFPDLSPSV